MKSYLPIDAQYDQEAYVRELEEQIGQLEDRILDLLERMPREDRTVLDCYIYAMRELQLYGNLLAYQKGKETARTKEKQGSG